MKVKLLFIIYLTCNLNCHTFNQTRNISRKIRGFNEVLINKILKVEKTAQTEIRISTIATLKDGSLIEKPMCISIFYDSNFEEYRFNFYKSKFVVLEECKSYLDTQALNYNVISQRVYFENQRNQEKKIIKKNPKSIVTHDEKFLIIPLEDDFIFIETLLPYKNKFSNYFGNINRPAYIKPEYYHYAFYPFGFTYDLLAGTLHTSGMPFYYACGYGFGRGLSNGPTGVLEKILVMSTIYINCPIAKVLIFPDGIKVNPDIVED
ncbi:hypothetical protein AB3N62_11325 [Leptospira sp. WS4.C2]